MRSRIWIIGSLPILLVVAVAAAFAWQPGVRTDTVRVVAIYPHDPKAFSQGLVIVDGQLYESTGQYGESSLRKVDLQTGRVEQIVPIAKEYFAEGLTALNGKLYQLTWKERLAIVYDLQTLRALKSFRYDGEGWGLTTDGKELIMSDGSHRLKFLDPETFRVTRVVNVMDGRRRVDKLNELEYVEGEVLANIWYSDRIARISPKTGQVIGWINAANLWPASERPSREHVLNGIAYDQDQRRLYLTGKLWPRLYEVEIVPGN